MEHSPRIQDKTKNKCGDYPASCLAFQYTTGITTRHVEQTSRSNRDSTSNATAAVIFELTTHPTLCLKQHHQLAKRAPRLLLGMALKRTVDTLEK